MVRIIVYMMLNELLFFQEYKREGNLIWPVLIDHVTTDMRIAWEEPFGPIVPLIRIKSIDEGVKHCNSSRYGLQVLSSQIIP